MRKLTIYILLLILISFLIPIIFTKKFGEDKQTSSVTEHIDNKEENIPKVEEPSYDYKKYNTVKVLHTKTNNIEEVNLDEYLYGVVSAEMPASFEKEALKAQSIVARTYTIYKIIHNGGKHEGADICDNSNCCQAWISKEDRLSKWEEIERESNWNKIVQAVNETKGKIITYNGEPINAFFILIVEEVQKLQLMYGEAWDIHIFKPLKHQEKIRIHNISQRLLFLKKS